LALLYPGVSPATSGKLGPNVFSRNRGGAYVRARVKGVNPNTALQQAVRTAFGQLSTQWFGVLSDADRASWSDWANATPRRNRLGSVIFLAGNTAYVGANTLRRQLGLADVNTQVGPNLLSTLSQPGTLTISSSTHKAIFSGLNAADEWQGPGGAVGLFISKPQNGTVNFFKGPYQYAGRIAGGTATLAAATVTLTGSLISGQLCYYRLAASSPDGRPSQVIQDGVITL
jgi:hypothetical protein